MIVLSYGMTKSGSTLAFELSKSILRQKGFVQRQLPDGVVAPGRKINFLVDLTVPALEACLAEVKADEIVAIKVHVAVSPPAADFVERQIAAGSMKIHVNLRDPREICLSLKDAGAQARARGRGAFAEIESVADAAQAVSKQLGACKRWGAIPGALRLFYNDVAFAPRAAIGQICADFGFAPLPEDEVEAVLDATFNDAFTQKNKAVKDRYKSDLTAEENEMLLAKLEGGRAFVGEVMGERNFAWFA